MLYKYWSFQEMKFNFNLDEPQIIFLTYWTYGYLAWKWLSGILFCIDLIYWNNLNTNQNVYNNRCQITKETWSWSQNLTGLMDTSMHYLPQFTAVICKRNHAITNQTITRMLSTARWGIAAAAVTGKPDITTHYNLNTMLHNIPQTHIIIAMPNKYNQTLKNNFIHKYIYIHSHLHTYKHTHYSIISSKVNIKWAQSGSCGVLAELLEDCRLKSGLIRWAVTLDKLFAPIVLKEGNGKSSHSLHSWAA